MDRSPALPRNQQPPDDAALGRAVRIDHVCSDFEARFRAGENPRIEDVLETLDEGIREAALGELLAVEFELRRARGEAIDLPRWQQRFPGRGDVVARAANDDPEAGFEAWCHAVNGQTEGTSPTAAPDRAVGAGPPVSGAMLPLRFEPRRALGEGGFGTVWLAYDHHLRRLVAVKRIRDDRALDEEARAMLRREARLAAGLSHPAIVEILELLEDDVSIVVVQEYLPGGDLAARIVPGGLPVRQVVEWMITVAEAVAFAHQHDLFHRDLKPANILLNDRGRPRVADFGLALRDEDLQGRSRGHRGGTVAYMAPEQVRGDAHRIDGRSDTWSLGVVLYELLTGRRPFQGTREQVIDQIRTRAPRPPRELRPEIPGEVERICLRCLARRQADRYSSAADLAAELARWLAGDASGTPPSAPPRVVPKGLRAFDASDHDFFLDLLPGPRDSGGLPEVIRFWKAFVERPASAPVGVIHGPSGCGKSSLARSGLLPRISADVLPVVVDAGADDTPRRLLAALRLRVPGLEGATGLVDAVASLRAGRAGQPGRRVLLVLDQFEQWLSGWSPMAASEIVDCLRQCDGQHVRALLLVRDDFWPVLLRLFERLEIALDSRENARGLDLFDTGHARRVLTLFGQAQGSLPSDAAAMDVDQRAFVEAAVEALADRGRVICVRLALFAELLKHRPWGMATLGRAGDADRLGVAFLEESLDPSRAPLERRRHAEGARRILRALLPAAGSPIRGVVRSPEALREIGGYGEDPHGFDEALHWLDGELRLVTPVVETAPAEPPAEGRPAPGTVVGYQLTHDFLLPALREWLLGAELSTPRGRTRHLLAERATLWHAHPTDRLLPGPWEHARILRHTRPDERSAVEARFLRRTAAVRGRQGLVAAIVLGTLACAGWIAGRVLEERSLAASASAGVARLRDASADRWEDLLAGLSAPRMTASVARALADAEPQRNAPGADGPLVQLRLLRLLALGDAAQLPAIHEAALESGPDTIRAVRDTLLRQGGPATLEPLWETATRQAAALGGPEGEANESRAFRAAVMLAAGPADDPRFAALAPRIAGALMGTSASEAVAWRSLLEPVRRVLVPEFLARYTASPPGSDARRFALEALVDAARDDGGAIAEAILESDPASFARLLPAARGSLSDVLAALRHELDGPDGLAGSWDDPPMTAWSPPPGVVAEMAQAAGEIHPAFAWCLALPAGRLEGVCATLGEGGYRPISFAPLFPAGTDGTVQVFWQRDGLPWTLRDGVSLEDILAEDRRQADLGHDVLAWATLAPDRFRALWGPGRLWGRARSRVPGPGARLERKTAILPRGSPLAFPATPWHVKAWRRSHATPGEDSSDDDGAKEVLAEGAFAGIQYASVAARRGATPLPRDVAMTAECTFHAEGSPLFLEATCVEGLSVSIDGHPLERFRRPVGAGIDTILEPLDITPGDHSLRVDLEWSQLDPRTGIHVGPPAIQSHRSTPDWMFEPVRRHGPDERTMGHLQPVFDACRVWWPWTAAPEVVFAAVRDAVRDGYRPVGCGELDTTGRRAIDLCRPRPAHAEVDRRAARRARALMGLLELDTGGDVWETVLMPALEPRPHPYDPDRLDATLATEVTLALADYPLVASLPWDRLRPEETARLAPAVRRALWLALGRAGLRIPAVSREAWSRRLDIPRQWWEDDDAGVHGAIDWLLRQWGIDRGAMPGRVTQPRVPAPGEEPRWWCDHAGQGFVLFPAGSFGRGGLDATSVWSSETAGWRTTTIEQPFALAATCVTLAEYQRFEQTRLGSPRGWKWESTHPKHVRWVDAVHYLNWRSDEAGLERCYEFDADGNVVIPADCLERDGYRFPTGDEWERAARAGIGTDWIHGSTPTRLGEFAWIDDNRDDRWSFPVGVKMPSPAGLFDMHGNGMEWMNDAPPAAGALSGGAPRGPETVTVTGMRAMRSGGVIAGWNEQRIPLTTITVADSAAAGIRPARTIRHRSAPRAGAGGDGATAASP